MGHRGTRERREAAAQVAARRATLARSMNYTDEDRARLATLKPNGRTWVGPKEVARCEHGRLYGFQWVASREFDGPDGRPTIASFESGDIERVTQGCAKCVPEDEDA